MGDKELQAPEVEVPVTDESTEEVSEKSSETPAETEAEPGPIYVSP